jgi:glycerate-2-kinase/FAD/FMN-containing dehydrogenase/Fe-S oxidoreductase
MEQLKEKPEHADARSIFDSTLQRVLPEPALKRCMSLDPRNGILTVVKSQYDLAKYGRILVVGGGKAARRTASELVKILGNRITAGVLNVYQDQAREPVSERITLFAADHPTPNEEGVKGARHMVELLKSADANTLVIALISGGGSSLMALPAPGVSLEDYQSISRLLLSVPATIDEINSVRKHLDPLKGGGMRKYAEHAGAFISLVLSDVPVTKTGIVDDPSVISSGPTVGDGSTFRTAYQVLTEHKIWDKSPKSIRDYILSNLDKDSNETLPKDSPLLADDKSQYVIIANNDQAMEAAKERAERLGYIAYPIGWNTGTTNDKIKAEVTQEIENIWKTVIPYVTDTDQITFASFSTDGIDGHSSLAGAIADADTLDAASARGLAYKQFLERYDSASFFQKLGLGIETGPSGTNVADVSLVLLTNPNNRYRKTAIIFGGEATVKVALPEGQKPGHGGRNTHLTLLAAEKMARRHNDKNPFDSETVKKGLIEAGVEESKIEISEIGRLGYSTDVGPISMMPLAIVGVRSHSDVEKTVAYAYKHGIPITARGSGSGLPAQSVGFGIILDMRYLDNMEVLGDHPDGGKTVFAQAGVICTRLNNFLKGHGVFLASYPSSTDMATIGGMIANNSSGANSCKLGTTRHQVMDLHVVLADGTSLWTSEIDSEKQPWKRITDLIRAGRDTIEKRFPKVPKNSSGYNVLDILQELEAGVPVDWSLLFAHSEGTLGIVTEAKLRAVPLPTQKSTCIVYFTDLREACNSIPKIYEIGPSCFDVAFTTNLDLIRKTFPALGIPEAARVMYLIEFDDLEVKADERDPARRVAKVRIMQKNAATGLIAGQVKALQKLLETRYPKTTMGFEESRDPARQDALWQGRRAALQVLYAYDPDKRPLTMIECVVLPRNEEKILAFINYMEEVFGQEGVVAGTHGHAGDCNFHIYLLLNLSLQEDRRRLITVMAKITEKVTELGGSMSGEHADGRTRGLILPHVFGLGLFDLFVNIKDLLDPRTTLHPGVKIIKSARDKNLREAIEELVGIEERDSKLNLKRFKNYSHLFSGVCSVCSQCSDICPVFSKLPEEFAGRTESAPTFKRALAITLENNDHAAALRNDRLFEKVFDLCLLCGQCTFKCATNATMIDMVARIRQVNHGKVLAPAIEFVMSHRFFYNLAIRIAGLAQGLWSNRLSRWILSYVPQRILSTHLPIQRYIPKLAKMSVQSRYPELCGLPASQAEIAYFTGCSIDLFEEPIVDGFISVALHSGWKVSLPSQRCCGEPFMAAGNFEEYHRLARYNIDRFADYKYIVAHCPTCLLAFKGYARDFARIGDTVYEKKALEIVKKVYDPALLIVEVIGPKNLKLGKKRIELKVAVHVSCHEKLGHKMGSSRNLTLDLLKLIPGVTVVNMKGADECCGLGGPWGLAKYYDLSVKLRQDKIANVMDSRADVVTSWCQGCMIQMRDGLRQANSGIAVRHPFELMSATYEDERNVIG